MMQPPKSTAGGAVCMAASHWEHLATSVNLLQAGASLGSHRDAETQRHSLHPSTTRVEIRTSLQGQGQTWLLTGGLSLCTSSQSFRVHVPPLFYRDASFNRP